MNYVFLFKLFKVSKVVINLHWLLRLKKVSIWLIIGKIGKNKKKSFILHKNNKLGKIQAKCLGLKA